MAYKKKGVNAEKAFMRIKNVNGGMKGLLIGLRRVSQSSDE